MGVYRRENAHGGGDWYVQFTDESGVRKTQKCPARTRRQAEAYLAQKKAEVLDGRFFSRPKGENVLFTEWADTWIELKEIQGRKSVYDLKSKLKVIKEEFAGKHLTEITRMDVERFFKKMRSRVSFTGQQVRPATPNRYLVLLKAILNYAVEEEYLDRNPAKRVKLLKENNERDRILTDDEAEALLAVAHEPLYGIILMAYETGMRRGEILNLKWDQVDLGEGFISLKGEMTKTNEDRTIPITPRLAEYLQTLPRHLHNPKVFHKKGNVLHHFSREWKAIKSRAELEDFHFHDLRHCFVYRARRSGIHDHVIMAITGHKTREMFKRYDSVRRNDLREAVGILANNCSKSAAN